MAVAENKVLVLCQRRSGKDGAGNNLRYTIRKLEQYVSTLVSSPKVEYMSPGLVDEKNTDVDYKMALDNNPESDEFLSKYRGTYQAIVFQTCGIMFLKNAIPYVYHLLQKNGIVVFTAFTHDSDHLIDLSKKNSGHNKDFITEFYRYFEPVTSTVNMKRDVIQSIEQTDSTMGRRSRKRKSKRYRRCQCQK